jgi:hypothetical protein
MGAAKDRWLEDMERIEGNREVAEEIMVRAEILQRCRSCGEAFDRYGIVCANTDLEPAYRIASAMFRDGDDLVNGYDRRDVLDTIRAIAADCGEECQCLRRHDD